jgi:hypothetical protein
MGEALAAAQENAHKGLFYSLTWCVLEHSESESKVK